MPGRQEEAVDLIAQAAALDAEARSLDNEAIVLMERAEENRSGAAALRGKADNLMDPLAYVEVTKTALDRAQHDPLFPRAAVLVEGMSGEYETSEVGVGLAIVDPNRVALLLRGLEELGKVRVTGAGLWRTVIIGEPEVRDYVLANRTGTVEECAQAAAVPVTRAQMILDRFYTSEVIVWDRSGRWQYVEPTGKTGARARRRPPENDPPAYTDARATGEAVRIVDHGKRAVPGAAHKAKIADKRWNEMQQANAAAAEAARQRNKKEVERILNEKSKRRGQALRKS